MNTQLERVEGDQRRFLFLLASSRREGNSEILARQAVTSLGPSIQQQWVRLSEAHLAPFEDIRHEGDGVYAAPERPIAELLDVTLWATELVFVAPLYWYGLPASAKLYLDHWSGWMRVEGVDFKPRMAGKTMWAITAFSDTDTRVAEPLFETLRLTAQYMKMNWGGSLLGFANRPGEIEQDIASMEGVKKLFSKPGDARAVTHGI